MPSCRPASVRAVSTLSQTSRIFGKKEADSHIFRLILPSVQKPYLYKSKAYKRNDTATIEADTLEFSRLLLEGKSIRFEELPCREQELLLKPMSEIAPYVPFGRSKTTQLLKSMGQKGIVVVEGKGRGTRYQRKR